MVRQAVNRNCGRIDVACDEELGGATVAVRLPVSRQREGADRAAESGIGAEAAVAAVHGRPGGAG